MRISARTAYSVLGSLVLALLPLVHCLGGATPTLAQAAKAKSDSTKKKQARSAPDLEISYGTAKLPAPVMERLRKEIMAVAETPAVRDKMAAAGLQMAAQYGEEFEKSASDEFNQWKTIVSAEHIVVEE